MRSIRKPSEQQAARPFATAAHLHRNTRFCAAAALGIVWMAAGLLGHNARVATLLAADERKPLDPAAWGSDHVGKPLPEFVTGDECLFCHRNDIGPKWLNNRHQLTLRPADAQPALIIGLKKIEGMTPFAAETQLLLGHNHRVYFLKQAQVYGKLDLLNAFCRPAVGDKPAEFFHPAPPAWNTKTFASTCAGCHATGVDAKTQAFTTVSIDCRACHGAVDVDHSTDTSLILLSRKRKDPARVVISICAQCHLRDGRSKTTNLPYPNSFVAGDNLFRDFKADFSDENLAKYNPGDRHVWENVRDVVIRGDESITCLTCHRVHEQSSQRHRLAGNRAICLNCHQADGPKSAVKKYDVHSTLCCY